MTELQGMSDLKREWADRLEYTGLVIEDDHYHIWGSSPIWGNDGRVHVFASRFPVVHGFYKWWATSQIAHYVSDQPEGPFSLVEVLLEPGQTPAGSWDSGAQHNPSIAGIDGLFVLTYHSNTATLEDRARPSHRIGMLTATDINGPWRKVGMVLGPPGPEETSIWSHRHIGGVDNPALIKHPSGKYYLYYRAKYHGLEGENTYGVAIADKLEGPYQHHPTRVVNNPTYIEDPYVFLHDSLIYMLVTDAASRGGLLLTSEDGLEFDYDEGVVGFGTMRDYVDPQVVDASPCHTAAGDPVFERPQILLTDGIPTHLYAPGSANINGGRGTCCYLFKLLTR